MITRIEINGFKSFHNFAVNLGPFQVLIGANGVGKSNLFDAIVLLSNLAAADSTLYDAFRNNRGEISELFTIYPDGSRADSMSFAVEMLIAKEITDALGVTASVSSTRLRYEVRIKSQTENGFERLYVTYESLTAITNDEDKWQKIISSGQRSTWIERGRRSPYLSTEGGMIYKHQDGRSGKKQESPIGRLGRTILSTVNSAEYPTAYAVRQEMLNWQFLQFNPMELRTPCGVYARTKLLPDGANLPAVLYRMKNEDELTLTDVSRDMANIVPGILDISVEALHEREEFLIEAKTTDGTVLSSRILSDGTLRLLALVTLKHDPQHRGVLCFEEPENGVHPERLQPIVDVLKSLATDFGDTEADNTPRQVLINTHSPKLMACVEDDSDLLYVYMTGQKPRETRMARVERTLFPGVFPGETSGQEQRFSTLQVKHFLDPGLQARKYKDIEERADT